MSEPVYRSQWDPDGSSKRNDCGPACVAMVLDGFQQHVTINDISAQIMPGQDVGTDAGDLVKALRDRGVNAQAWAGLTYPPAPYMALVNYAGFDRANVQDVNFRGWHWLIVLSMSDLTVVCHDPDYSGARRNEGDRKRYSRAEFDAAFIKYGQTKIAVVWEDAKPTVTMTPTSGTVASDADFLRVRAAPNSPTITGYLGNGSAVAIIGQANDALGRPWYQIKRTATYPFTFTDEAMTKTMTAEFTGWSYAALIKVEQPPGVPPPIVEPPSASVLLGFNALADGAAAGGAYNQGARFFLHMNDTDTANALASRGATVMYRQYWDHAPSVDEAVAALGTRLHPDVIRTGINENEFIDGRDIKFHAAFDAAVATRLRAINPAYRYAGGTYSMGTPDFTNPGVCDAIKQYYAPAYNSGLLWFDMHLYSPNMQHIYQGAELIWYERRWEFLFTRCGFDPTVRHIVSGECGVDEGGVGGFAAHNATDEQVVAYCKRWRQVQAVPLILDGTSYPSSLVGGALFQLGDTGGRWDGYDLRRYTSAMQTAGVFA